LALGRFIICCLLASVRSSSSTSSLNFSSSSSAAGIGWVGVRFSSEKTPSTTQISGGSSFCKREWQADQLARPFIEQANQNTAANFWHFGNHQPSPIHRKTITAIECNDHLSGARSQKK
jgi:hypothetical protein